MKGFVIATAFCLACATTASAQQPVVPTPNLAIQQQYAERVATLQAALDAAL